MILYASSILFLTSLHHSTHRVLLSWYDGQYSQKQFDEVAYNLLLSVTADELYKQGNCTVSMLIVDTSDGDSRTHVFEF
jgi:hypothetical protein